MLRRFDTFGLYAGHETIAFEPPSVSSKNPSLLISKGDGEISLTPTFTRPAGATVKKTVHGILGMANLPLGKALVVITKRVRVGEFGGHILWQLESVDLITLASKPPRSSEEAEAHRKCIRMLMETLSTPYFYFSGTMDMTNSQQRQWQTEKDFGQATTAREVSRRLDKRFLWNESLLRPFNLSSASDDGAVFPFLMPIIHGAVFVHKCAIKMKPFTWAIISRRSRHMVGTRFFARGADSRGNVANFCETEQLTDCQGQVASYIQTRGSMPMIWEQVPNLKYKPDPTIVGSNEQNLESFRNHFREQVSLYGEQVAVNLIDQKKAEGQLESAFCKLFNDTATTLTNIHYEAFDFHRECSKMRYDRLSILMDQLSNYEFGYFVYPQESSGTPPLLQTGVFRTNCIDCLDRTNVVQSLLASRNLANVLHRFGVLSTPSTAELEQERAFQHIYRNTWADHANLISVQYAGTGALKTDFTREGVRTRYGYVQDGWNAGNRYIKNNFCDGARTDGLRFFVGDLTSEDVVDAVAQVMKEASKDENRMIGRLPTLLVIFLALFLISLIWCERLTLGRLTVCSVALALAGGCLMLIMKNNKFFVNFPLKTTIRN